ncbi:hypothetical protein BDR05DRAFT_1007000 [Suillus weaverae]|nr:hypothetical protein BDR05DRAFT_1007000 [Suillus weaverae]
MVMPLLALWVLNTASVPIIGAELAAKLLLFLDESVSSLDSQSACAIMKFLRKLAN